MRALLFFVVIGLTALPAYAAPRIVVTLNPVHALVSGVTEGVTQPELLVRKNMSPHTYALKPSDVKKLHEADIVFFVSTELETFLFRALRANRNNKAEIVELAKSEGISLLPVRESNFWAEATEESVLPREAHDHPHRYDPHLWLDPANAVVIVENVADILARRDPEHAVRYRANAKKMVEMLHQLDKELKDKLAPYSAVPYLVFHDAYHYFENRYHLGSLGAVMMNPNKEPGAKTMNKIQDVIKKNNVICLFSEPQFSPSVVNHITTETGIGTGVLDAEWGSDATGKEAYFILMRAIGKNLLECFDKKRSLMS